jgi:predicted small lipoprotein YifL
LLAACGQTGPLHLPADEPAKERYLIAKKKEPKPAVATNVKPAEAPAADPVPPEAASPGDQPTPSPQP